MWSFIKSKKKTIQPEQTRIVTEEMEIEKIAKRLNEVLADVKEEMVILCIGSDRSTGDSLGPLVGTMLMKKQIPVPVYGTLEKPIHALNLVEVLKIINEKHTNPFILGIDACLGDERQIGMVLLKEGSFFPGNAVNQKLPRVGNFHLKAIVNSLEPFAPVQSLNSTRLYTVMRLAEIITKIISRVVIKEQTTKVTE